MTISFTDVYKIKDAGFEGFLTIAELMDNLSLIPKCKGIYLVLDLTEIKPIFLKRGTGPVLYKKKRDINVDSTILSKSWVDGTIILNIGKAGGINQKGVEGKATLRSRLRQYLQFGKGKDIGHLGGRLIWQLQHSRQLILCWKQTPNDEPRNIEEKLIKDFSIKYKRRPFANMKD